ncbi:hypothetical protein [Haloplanus rubicundus]|uniref:Uncharacterized protein n=1 Tax=Haloplanus rubicundus TaxID=1547898 RepID=A0A345E8L9_9EURY|nr:hypothetical protein [Haloplanus rubicundus]AXG08541.1 hypothetical protein DU484_00995 [Haloplanus rubicundus]
MESGDENPAPPGSADDTEGDETGTDLPLARGEFVLLGGLVVVLVAAVALGMSGPAGTTATGADGGSTPTPAATAAETTPQSTAERAPAIAMRVRSIESCGTRCRSVTVALSNEGSASATEVRVSTRITTDGSLVWEGQSDVGSLDAGQTVTRTRTVRVGYVDAARIEANDGVVRIETTVRTASGTRVFTERRDVS